MSFNDRLYSATSRAIYEDAQVISDANGAPVAILERDGWLAICEEPPDEMDSAPLEHGWKIVALIEPTEEVEPFRKLTRQERLEGLADRGVDTWDEYRNER